MSPASAPMQAAAHGRTYPAAGVTVASPATAPVSAPVIDGLFSRIHPTTSQVIMATDPAMSVLTKAVADTPLAASALPALKPNQPNHNRPVPSATKAML